MNIYKRLLSDSFAFFANSFFSKVVAFFMVSLYTRYLSASVFGDAELINDTAAMLLPLITMGITDGIMRFTLERKKDASQILNIALLILGLGSALLVCATPLIRLTVSSTSSLVFIILLTITMSLESILGAFVKGCEKTKLFALVGIIRTVFMALFHILFIVVLQYGMVGYLLSLELSYLVAVMFYLTLGGVLRHLHLEKIDKVLAKRIVLYSLPLISNSICWRIVSLSDRFFLKFMVGSATVGLYTVAQKIPTMVSLVTTIFIQAWQFTATRAYLDGTFDKIYHPVQKIYCSLLTGGGLLLLLINRPLMSVYVGEEYFQAYQFIPLLVLSSVFNAMTAITGSAFMVSKKTGNVFKSSLVAAITNIALNVLLIPRFEIWGAIIATTASYIVSWAFRVYDCQRLLHLKTIDASILTLLSGLSLCCVLDTLEIRWLSYPFIGIIFLCILIFNWKIIASVIRGWKEK